jgi:amino acid permease
MMQRPAFRRFTFAFGAAFAVFYVLALAKKLSLFTVYPSLGLVLWGTHYAHDVVDPAMGFLAPAMYWYGWAATAALGALVAGLLAAVMPERWARQIWVGWLWVVPVAAMLGCVYLTLPWFSLNP